MMDEYPQQIELTPNQMLSSELIEQSQSGEEQAITAVYMGVQPVVEQVVRRLERSSDIAKDLIFGALERVITEGVYHQRFQRQDEGDFAGWAARVTRNLVVDDYRRRARGPQFDTIEDDGTVRRVDSRYKTPSAEESVIADESISRIESLFSKADIPDIFSQAFVMYHIRQMSGEEIAQELQIPIATVRTRVYRAVQQLKKHYGITDKSHPGRLSAALASDYTEAV